jgi:hypothetical protein
LWFKPDSKKKNMWTCICLTLHMYTCATSTSSVGPWWVKQCVSLTLRRVLSNTNTLY